MEPILDKILDAEISLDTFGNTIDLLMKFGDNLGNVYGNNFWYASGRGCTFMIHLRNDKNIAECVISNNHPIPTKITIMISHQNDGATRDMWCKKYVTINGINLCMNDSDIDECNDESCCCSDYVNLNVCDVLGL